MIDGVKSYVCSEIGWFSTLICGIKPISFDLCNNFILFCTSLFQEQIVTKKLIRVTEDWKLVFFCRTYGSRYWPRPSCLQLCMEEGNPCKTQSLLCPQCLFSLHSSSSLCPCIFKAIGYNGIALFMQQLRLHSWNIYICWEGYVRSYPIPMSYTPSPPLLWPTPALSLNTTVLLLFFFNFGDGHL